jgi:beta-glucosidase
VADLIFGDAVPSGKLPLTFPESVGQLPPYEDYSMQERTYRYMTSKPLYPFGYGLSYTDFVFNDLYLDQERITPSGKLTISLKVKNSGERRAEEVVQLYISVPDPDGIQPRWSLKDFKRVEVAAGSTAEVGFELEAESLESLNSQGESKVVPGTYTVYVGNGSPGERSQELGVNILSSTFVID